MFNKLFKKTNKKEIELKTKAFSNFARSIGAIENIENISIEQLLSLSYEYLQQERVTTIKQEKELLVFKDQYNRYLEYCIDQKMIKKDQQQFVDTLLLIKVPDMSHIKVPDISKEIKEMDIDLDQLSNIFSKIKLK